MRGPRSSSAFTLLELLVVIAIVAVIAGTLAVSVARSTPERVMTRALDEVTTELSIARVEAMQRGRPESVELWATEKELGLARGERERLWAVAKAVIVPSRSVTTRLQRVEPDGGRFGGVRADFDTMGRTHARRWEVWYDGTPGRIWAIEFDPVSGAPSMRRPGA